MATDKKSLALATYLQAELSLLLVVPQSVTVTGGEDASGNPLILIGDLTVAGNKSAVVRVRPFSWPLVETSIPTIAQPVYGPHYIELCYENVAANTVQFLDAIKLALPTRGCRTIVYRTAAATVASATAMVAANQVAQRDAEVYQGMVGDV